MQTHSRPFNLREFKIEVTHRCSLNCVHCSSDAGPSNLLAMARDDCMRILREAATMGAEDVVFSGGEPLLWPHIADVVEAAMTHSLGVTAYTSGNVNDFHKTAMRLYSLGLGRFVFSIFGATSEDHERITRTTGSFDNTCRSVQHAVAIGSTAEFHFVPMSGNYRQLGSIAELAHKLGVSRISILRLVPQGRGALVRGRVLNRVQNLELRQQISSLRKAYGVEFVRTGSPYNFLLVNEAPGCWAAIDRLIVGPDLRLYPCDAFKCMGAAEVVETDDRSSLASATLPECWAGSPYLEAVRAYLTTDFEPPCDSCRLLEKCVSGCLAQKVIAYGSLDKKPDPDCLGPSN